MFETPDDWKRWNKKEWQEHPEKMFNFNVTINDLFGKDIYIFGSHLYGLFEQIWQPFGFRKFMQLIRKEKGFLEEIIEYNKNWYLKCVDASADAGFPAIIYSDDMAFKNGPMLNPKMMDQLLGAAFREITDHAHKKGVKIVIHTDGNTKPLLEYFIKWGFDGHHSIEPNADDVDLGEYKEIAGDRLSLLGHLDITHVLSFGSKEDVVKHVEDSAKKAGKGGGLILGPCNSHYDIKVQNLRWMIEACENMTYPLNV
jgi:uroporphyrinogen decarboxylase